MRKVKVLDIFIFQRKVEKKDNITYSQEQRG